MAKKGNEKTQFKKGNRDAEKWSLELAEELFNKAYEYALINKDCFYFLWPLR